MIKLLDKIILVVSIIAMSGLIGAYTSSYINPNLFVIPSLLGLAYPYFLIANILLLLYWVTRWEKTAFVILGVILLGIPFFMTYYGTNGREANGSKHDLSVLSYNIRYFDMYGWSKNKNTKEKLFDYLNQSGNDIACLQEFPIEGYRITPLEAIKNLTNYKYHHIYRDMAIFSRLPIIGKGQIAFNKKYSGTCIFCDIPINNDTIRIYSVHLESYRLGKKERQFVKDISEGQTKGALTQGVKNITTRVINANKNRAKQAELIKQHINKSPYKVILCGDFNDTPLSYTYKQLSKELKDSFIEKGRGLGNTYIGEFPSFRIDYILHASDIETISYVRETITLSDHYPVVSKLRVKNKK